MTKKIYKTARGRTVDLGALILQNEHVRAVGNMNVNARGDLLDSSDRVIDSKNRQIKRQNQRQINKATASQPVAPTASKTRVTANESVPEVKASVLDTPDLVQSQPTSGLAAAIARTKQNQDPNQ